MAISATARAVGTVTKWPTKTIINVETKPTWATAYPNRKNKIAPRMVEMAVKNTGQVPIVLRFSCGVMDGRCRWGST